MRLAIVFHLTGTILRFLGIAFVAPLLVALYYKETADAVGFVAAGLLAVVAGQALRRRIGKREWVLRRVEALAVVVGTYLLVAAIGAVPYAMAGLAAVDAVFESMSGITATGATILTDFGSFGRGLMFWRSMSQWLGGMGVITLFIAVLPRLAIGGRQLFFTEAPGLTDGGLAPQIRKTAAMLWRLYVGLTLAEFVALMLAGLPAYDAICHAIGDGVDVRVLGQTQNRSWATTVRRSNGSSADSCFWLARTSRCNTARCYAASQEHSSPTTSFESTLASSPLRPSRSRAFSCRRVRPQLQPCGPDYFKPCRF